MHEGMGAAWCMRAGQGMCCFECISASLLLLARKPPLCPQAVVFSQFTSMLQLVAVQLQQTGIPFTRLEGSTSAKVWAGGRACRGLGRGAASHIFCSGL